MVGIRTESRTAREERFRLGPRLSAEPLRNRILRDGQVIPVEPRVMELLVYLSARAGQLVTKRELMDQVWGANVVDQAIQRAVSLLRSALGDSAQDPRIIETVPGQGYRMLLIPSAVQPSGSRTRWFWLAAGAAVAALASIAIVGTQRPIASQPPVPPAAQRVGIREPARTKASPEMRAQSSRLDEPSRLSQSPRTEEPEPTPAPTPRAVLAPPAPVARPQPSGEAPPAREAPTPPPSPDGAP